MYGGARMRTIKAVLLLALLFSLLLNIGSYVLALDPDDFKPSTIDATETIDLLEKVAPVVKIIRNIGIIISAISLTVIGTQYIMGSSLDQKAQIKEKLFPLLCGCFLIAGIFTLVDLIISFTNNI